MLRIWAIISVLIHSLSCQSKALEGVNAWQFLAELDAEQYYLGDAGVASLKASYKMTAEGIMEVGDKVMLHAAWKSRQGFSLVVKSDDWETFHPKDVKRELNDFLDDLLLGRRFAEMLKDFTVTVNKNGSEHHVVADNPSANPQHVELWVDRKMRVYRATIKSKDIPFAEFEFEYRTAAKKWILDEIQVVKIKTADEENIARGFKRIKVDYGDYKNAAGKEVKILRYARAEGKIYELDEGGNPDPNDPGEDVELELILDTDTLEIN